jgi:predicted nucleic acid-binding protein
VVLDASAAIEIALGRSQAARLAGILAEADVVLAPELYVSEVVNTIWK